MSRRADYFPPGGRRQQCLRPPTARNSAPGFTLRLASCSKVRTPPDSRSCSQDRTRHRSVIPNHFDMAEAPKDTPAAVAAPAEQGSGKTVVVVGVEDSEHSYYALEWAVRHVARGADELVIVHAKPSASSVVGVFGGPGLVGAGEAMRCVEADLRKTAETVVDRARRVCVANSVHALVEVIEGEPRNVLCGAAEKHRADLLVVGSHGYGAIKRAFLGSVSDYCAHHAHCSVMIVKEPKHEH